MVYNICFAWISSFVIIVGYGYISHRRRTTRKVSGLVQAMSALMLMTASIFYYSASASLGAIATLFLIAPSGEAAARLEIGMGIIFGMWVMAILLQLCMNVSRRFAGAPPVPIVFFNSEALRFKRSRRKKHGDGTP